jgi:hypothetical protein
MKYPIAISLGLLIACTAHAGVYNPGEFEEGATYPEFMESKSGKNFFDVLVTLRSISVPRPEVDNPVRRRYIFEEELIGKLQTANLRFEDRLQGSAVLMRRRKPKEAELLLRPAAFAPEGRENIPLQSNLATALHLSGDLNGAYLTLRPVVKELWKTTWGELPEDQRRQYSSIGWSEPLYDLYRDYDAYYLKLLTLRRREKKGEGILQPPDALFDDGKDPPTPVRFVSEAGDFAAGKIAVAEKAKLDKQPRDALAIVQQLLVWLPDDLRLYWLLGEMYNAQGTPKGMRAAKKIFEDLGRASPVSADVKDQLRRRVGALDTAVAELNRNAEQGLLKDQGLDQPEEKIPTVDWRAVVVSFGGGFVFAVFVFWQVREIQRRRQVRQSVKATRA